LVRFAAKVGFAPADLMIYITQCLDFRLAGKPGRAKIPVQELQIG
jgi:hypothetical protein